MNAAIKLLKWGISGEPLSADDPLLAVAERERDEIERAIAILEAAGKVSEADNTIGVLRAILLHHYPGGGGKYAKALNNAIALFESLPAKGR